MTALLFGGWPPVLQTLVPALLAYVALIALLRAPAPRTLSTANAFVFVVTIALGSTMSTTVGRAAIVTTSRRAPRRVA